jgi:[ribosomal protein S5]-alanine N-acetyltransferase
MIRTPRLDLVPGTVTQLRAELDGRTALAAALHVEVPEQWPPELYDADAIRWTLDRLDEAGTATATGGWGFYYFVQRDPRPVLVGCGGFKTAPDARGDVELGYAVAVEHRRRGLATEAVQGLVRVAFDDPHVRVVFAHTIPSLPASIGVLDKARFRFAGEGHDPDAPDGELVLRYEITRDDVER